MTTVSRRSRARVTLAVAVALALLTAGAATAAPDADRSGAAPGRTRLVSVGLGGSPGNGSSGSAKISTDGNRVAFGSSARNLVRGDDDGGSDLFVRTRSTGRTVLVDLGWDGEQSTGPSRVNELSRTGRYVAYDSAAADLVPNDTNDQYDIFVRDLRRQRSERVSVSSSGEQANSYSNLPAISSSGRFVAYTSYATNLVPDDTNGGLDVFLRDRREDTTTRVSEGEGGVQAAGESASAVISANGRVICYVSNADNLTPDEDNEYGGIFCVDRIAGVPELVSHTFDGSPIGYYPVLGGVSAGGRYVVFSSLADNIVADDTNEVADVFVRDLRTDTTRLVSVTSSGEQADAESFWPSISDDGAVVSFDSLASNLVGDDTNGKYDVYVHRLDTGRTRRASVSTAGAQGNLASLVSNLSGDGRFVVFNTGATNLVPGDTNGAADVLVRGPLRAP